MEGTPVDAKVVKLPESLAVTERAITLKGEVVAQNPDGTVRIATPRGPVDVQLPQGQTAQRGQTVEVQVPAGAPPRTVTVTLPQTPPQVPPQTVQPQPLPVLSPAQTAQPTPSVPVPAPPAPAHVPQQAQTQQTTLQPLPQGQGQPQAVTPQGLMEFLKTSLQTILKAPATAPVAMPDSAPPPQQTAPNAGMLAQRPLQLGQMARLTPLPSGTPLMPLGTPPAGAQSPQPQSPQLAGSFNSAAPAAMQKSVSIPMPAHTPPQTPLQATLNATLGTSAAFGGTQQIPLLADPVARILLPLMAMPQQPAAAALQSPLPVSVATPLLASLLNLGAETLPAPQAVQAQQAVPQAPRIPVGIQIPAQGAPAALPVMDVRVTAILPAAPMGALQNAGGSGLLGGTPASPVLFGQVTGQTAQGLPVIALPTFTTAPDGTARPAPPVMMALQYPAKGLPAAAVLRMDVLQQGVAPPPAGTSTALPWDSLDDAVRQLRVDPANAGLQQLQAALPKPGATHFAAPVLMFVAALRGGDVTQWLGDKTVDALRALKKGDALARVGASFSGAARGADDPASARGDWRTTTLPMMTGEEVRHIMLHTKGFTRDGDGPESPRKSGTRFVMDLSLARMGPLQVDGFSLDKRLDVTLRSEQPLSAAMRESMRERYAFALEGIGFAGQLNFSAAPDHKGWMDIKAG